MRSWIASQIRRFADTVEPPTMSRGVPIAPESTGQVGLSTQVFTGFPTGEIPDWNPDEIVARHGVRVWRKMMREDEQAKAAIQFRILARLASGYTIQPGGKLPSHETHKDFIEAVIKQMRGSMNGLLSTCQDALGMGFSAVELVPGLVFDAGPFRNKIGISHFHALDQEWMEFKSDPFGNLLADGIWQRNPHFALPGILEDNRGLYRKLPRDRFIVHSHNKTTDNWYGESDLRPAWPYKVLKEVTLRHWGFRLETFGQPFVFWEGPEEAGNLTKAQVLQALERLRKYGYGTVPAGWKLHIEQPTNQATVEFRDLLNICNRGEARAVLLPSLLLESTDVGAYALGEKHQDQFVWVLDNDGKTIEEDLIGEQFIRPLIERNFGSVDEYPYLQFQPYHKPDLEVISNALQALTNMGLEVGKQWVYEKTAIPQPEDGDEILEPQRQEPAVVGDPLSIPPEPDEEGAASSGFIDEIRKSGWEPTGQILRPGQAPMVFARKRWREPFEHELSIDFDEGENDIDEATLEGSDTIGLALTLAARTAADLAKKKRGHNGTSRER